VRILIASPTFAPQVGGAETWSLRVAEGLIARGHAIEVVARAAPRGVPSDVALDVPVRRVTGGRFAFARGIGRSVEAIRPDVVMAQYSALPISVLVGRKVRIPVMGVVHDVYGFAESVRIKGPLVGPIRHLGLERSLRLLGPDAFLVPSRSTARALTPLARGRRVTVVPAGVDPFESGPGSRPDPARVVFVGRLVPQKGGADLVEAIRIVAGRGIGIQAVIVGEGPESGALRSAARGLPIRFTGRLSDDELDDLVRGSAALVLPSTREGWGLVVTEAAARGVPYVAYDIPALREQYEELGGGLLVDPTPAALADAIATLLNDPALRERLGAAGRAATAGRSWGAAAEVVERALAALVR